MCHRGANDSTQRENALQPSQRLHSVRGRHRRPHGSQSRTFRQTRHNYCFVSPHISRYGLGDELFLELVQEHCLAVVSVGGFKRRSA
ncbi:hypothetical protein AMS68_001774 [Peltaster fructicola]|uniref:Uncharacterized protein n=1 Tax=Peltaster fructicola TaxID=286661 RepID=A0A6H0XNC6_9PEZI|nr:hypothetical protein AMS68_001774 [Peltaster fructicola]